jgi:DNA-binding transcriptional LysR family regulator
MTRDRRYKEIQLAQLRSFCLAATEGNFTSAARALGLSASTVWHQVRALERELKAKLLRRRGRAVELTDEGQLLLQLVQPHVSGLDSLGRFFESRRASSRQELVVASGAYLLAHHLPAVVKHFRAERPLVQVTLRVGSWAALHRLSEREQVDVAILACDPDVPRSPYLEYESLFDEPLSLLAPTDHPLARARRITPAEVVKYPLILPPPGGADRKALDRLLSQHDLGDRVRPALVCGLIDVAKSYVLAGVGIALMYVTAEVTRTTPGLRVRPLEADVGRLPIAMAVRKGAHLPEWVQDFQRIARQLLSEPSPDR